jgi:YD repeat-containing protein
LNFFGRISVRYCFCRIALLTSFFLGLSSHVWAQLDYLPQVGIKEFATYQHSDIDSVDLTTGNVNLHIPLVGFPQKGGKLRLDFVIRYNEPQWYAAVGVPTPIPSGGYTASGFWKVNTSGSPRSIGVDVVRDQGVTGVSTMTPRMAPGTGGFGDPVSYYSEVAGIRDRSGATHILQMQSGVQGAPTSVSFMAPDGSGWLPVATYGVRDKDGLLYTSFHPSGVPGTLPAWNISDPHGNTITTAADGWHDSLDRHIPGSWDGQGAGFPDAPNGYPPSEDDPFPGIPSNETWRCNNGAVATRTWVVPSSTDSGGSQTYYFCYSQYSANTHFNVNGRVGQITSVVLQEAQFSAILLSKILLPNNTSYSFQYDPNFLDLTRIDLPTGGVITYDWTIKTWETCSTALPVKRVVSQRTVTAGGGAPASVSKYNWGPYGVCNPQPGDSLDVIITKPDGNDEWHHGPSTYSPTLVRDVDYYKGLTNGDLTNVTGIQLQRVETTALYKASALFTSVPDVLTNDQSGQPVWIAGYSIHENFPGPVEKTVTTLYDPATQQVQSSQERDSISLPSTGSVEWWNPDNFYYPDHGTCACLNYSEIKTTKDYDFVQGSGAGPGPLLRRIETSYRFQDAGGQIYADAGLTSLPSSVTVYDGQSAQASQTTYAYDESSYSSGDTAGELTTTSRQLVGSAGSSWVSTNTNYSPKGVWAGSTDASGNVAAVTSFDCSGLSPSNVTLASGTPVAETVVYVHDCNAGKITSYTDANGKATTYGYADSLSRIRSVNFPDQGHVQVNYTDGTGSSVNILTDTGGLQGQMSQTVFYDLLGRTTSIQTSAPAPDNTISVDTVYDSMGRVHSTSNPYTSTKGSTNDTTISDYDNLGRIHQRTNPDGSSQSWSYSGNVVTFTDEVAHAWQRTSDALGRLTKVVEPTGATTSYSYNALGNLVLVSQQGSTGETPRTRSFKYDTLSRLVLQIILRMPVQLIRRI